MRGGETSVCWDLVGGACIAPAIFRGSLNRGRVYSIIRGLYRYDEGICI